MRNEKILWKKFKMLEIKKKKFLCLDNNVLAAYLENGASKKQVKAIEEHLTSCSDCLNTLNELRLLLKEETLKPPQEVIESAKVLLSAQISEKQRAYFNFPFWIKNSIVFARYSFGMIAILILTVVVSITAIRFGHDTFINQHQISQTSLSELSFGLSDNSGSGIDNMDLHFYRRLNHDKKI